MLSCPKHCHHSTDPIYSKKIPIFYRIIIKNKIRNGHHRQFKDHPHSVVQVAVAQFAHRKILTQKIRCLQWSDLMNLAILQTEKWNVAVEMQLKLTKVLIWQLPRRPLQINKSSFHPWSISEMLSVSVSHSPWKVSNLIAIYFRSEIITTTICDGTTITW